MQAWHIIGVGSGWGAQDMRTADGPKTLMAHMPALFQQFSQSLSYWHRDKSLHISNPAPLPALQAQIHVSHVLEMATALCGETKNICLQGKAPLVLGGDHSIAIGTWSGVKSALGDEDLGLIWVDAHMDAHLPQTSPSLNMHGMPIAILLGKGDAQFMELGGVLPKLKPQNLCLIGVRSFEKEEADFLSSLGVRVFFMEDVRREGFTALFQKARRQISARRFGVSIDIDVFDPMEAPGTGVPELNGLQFKEDVKKALHGLAQDPCFLGLEITEFNPYRDIDNKTCRLVWDLAKIITGENI